MNIEYSISDLQQFRRYLQRRYVFGISIFLVLGCALLMSAFVYIRALEHYPKIINTIGYQRTLSQEISKSTLALATTKDSLLQQHYRGEAAAMLQQFENVHRSFATDSTELGFATELDTVLREKFYRLEPYYQAFVRSVSMVLQSKEYTMAVMASEEVLGYEPLMLRGINDIVLAYQQKAEREAVFVRWLMLMLFILISLGGAAQVLLVYHPAREQMNKVMSTLTSLQANLFASNTESSYSKKQYELLVDTISENVYQVDREGRFVFANAATLTFLGRSLPELIGQHYAQYVHPDYAQRLANLYRKLLEQQSPSETLAFPMLTPAKEQRWVEQSLNVIKHRGEVKGFIAIARDITERREIEQALQESEQKLHVIIQNAPLILLSFDSNGIIKLSDGGKPIEALGLKPGEWTNYSIFELYQSVPQIQADVRLALAGKAVRGIRTINDLVFETVYNPVLDVAGNVMNVIGIFLNVTEQVTAESSLKEISLQQSAILDSSPSAVISTTLDGTVTLFNRAAEDMLGYTAEEVIGKHSIIEFFDAKELDQYAAELQQSFGIAPPKGFHVLLEKISRYRRYKRRWMYITKIGQGIPVELSLAPLKDLQGNITGLLAIANDTTDQDYVERLKTDFISTVTHEIRTPLHAIIGMTELLTNTKLSEEQRELVGIAQSKADLLLTLINDILEYSKIQANSVEVQEVPVNLVFVIENVLELISYRAYQKGLSFKTDIGTELPDTVLCDPVRFYQVLLNLADILIKFTEHGEVHLKFDIMPVVNPLSVGIYISFYSTGLTMSREAQEKLISQMIDLEPNIENFTTQGLQVAVIRNIIHQMGGLMWVETQSFGTESATKPEREEGSNMFHLFFALETIDPATKEAETADISGDGQESLFAKATLHPTEHKQHDGEVSDTPPAIDLPAPAQHAVHILLVDDNEDNRNLAQTFLKSLGHDNYRTIIDIAENGAESVAAFQNKLYDVVLMDIQMPVMDGFEATKTIRAFEKANARHRTPIVAVTAHVMENYREQCLAVGMDDYISKPVKKKQLQELVKKWIDTRPCVLIADDSPDIRLLLKLQFEKKNKYNIVFAKNGQEAVDIFQQRPIALVIMDMEMPVLNGYEAVATIRGFAAGKDIPIFALSAHEKDKEVAKSLEAGCTKHFVKSNLATMKVIEAEVDTYLDSTVVSA